MLIAILLVMGLSIFGISTMMQSTMEDMVSLHNMSSTQALLSADAAVEMSVPWLSYDHRNDPAGWSNQYLITPAPTGVTPTGLRQDDVNGTVTGVADAYYFDLSDLNGNGTPDQVAPALTPYDVPAAVAFSGADSSLLPMGQFAVRIRNLSDDTAPAGGAPVVFSSNKIVIELSGWSENLASHFGAEATEPSVATIEVLLDHSTHSIWDNAAFSNLPIGAAPSNTTLHGSVHIINDPIANAVALELTGGSRILNNYETLSAILQARIPDEPGVPGSLSAEVRARGGSVEITSAASSVGEPDGATGPATKDTLDGAYLAGGAFGGPNASNAYVDDIGNYDQMDFTFLKMMEANPYTDPLTSTTYASYYDYLRGSSDGTGVNALDLSFFNLHGGDRGNASFNRASNLFNPDQSFAQQLEWRYPILVSEAFNNADAGTELDVYIEQVDGSWGLQTYLAAGGTPAQTPLVDATGVFGVTKEVPPGVPGSSNPFPAGYVHGMIWIPPDVTVPAAGAAIIDGMILEMNPFLDEPIVSPTDVGTGTILPVPFGRMYASGVLLTHRLFMNRGVTQDEAETVKAPQPDSFLADIAYTGSFTMISEHISQVFGDLLPMRQFPCEDAIGIASTNEVDMADADMLAAGAFYAEEEAIVAQGAHVAGGVVAGDDVRFEGANTHIAAVPSLKECLPPYMPDVQIFTLAYRSWTEIR